MNASTPERGVVGDVTDVTDVIDVVVYGDFNCPFSVLAHRRATQQQKDGLLRVEWRVVEHDPEISLDGVPVDTRTHDQFEEELGQIRGLLVDGEADVLRVPSRRPNTSRLNALYASTPIAERSDFRQSVFDAYWVDDRDLNSAEFVERLTRGHCGRRLHGQRMAARVGIVRSTDRSDDATPRRETVTGSRRVGEAAMIIDGFTHQLPDVDPVETEEWLDSLDAVIDIHGPARARLLMSRLLERVRHRQVGVPAMVSTPYVNTIPADEQVW